MNKVKVNYKTEILTKNGSIRPDGFSSIEFQNAGDDNALIMDDIPLDADADPVIFVNRPGEIITNNMKLQFTTSTSPKVVIIKTYYEITNEQV